MSDATSERFTDPECFIVKKKFPLVAEPPLSVGVEDVQAPKLTVPKVPRLDPKR